MQKNIERDMRRIIKKYSALVDRYHFEPSEISDGLSVWVSLKDGYIGPDDCHSLHADEPDELLGQFLSIRPCGCGNCL